jgi:hypothetical protein
MKYVKILALAAVAATALMALLGTSLASATVLCKENAIPCPELKVYPAKTNVSATTEPKTSVVFRSTGGTELSTCSFSTIEGQTEKKGGEKEPIVIPIAQLSWFECTSIVLTRELGTLEIDYIGPETRGTFTMKNVRVTVSAFGVTCTYGTGATAIDIGTAKGTTSETSPATLTVSAVVPKVEGSFLCPADAVWEGSYNITEPAPLYFKEK